MSEGKLQIEIDVITRGYKNSNLYFKSLPHPYLSFDFSLQLFFATVKSFKKPRELPWTCLQLFIDIVMGFALALGNGLIVRKVMKHKKLLPIKSSAKIQMCVELISQLVLDETKKCVFVFNRTKNLDIGDLY